MSGKEAKRVLLLGCGAVGTVAAKHLAASRRVDGLVAADVSLERAKGLAKATRSRKVRPRRFDLNDEGALHAAMRGTSLVINAALPRFNLAVMKAAFEAGSDYMDLAGGGVQFRQDAAWKRAGLTALLGMGEDPGLANVFARHAADRMDEVASVKIRDGETSESKEFPFVCLFSPETFIEEVILPPAVFENGRWKHVPPFTGYEEYPFPKPIGNIPVYYVDHEEVETIPRFLGKKPSYVDFKLALLPDTVRTLQLIHRAGFMSEETGLRKAFLASIPPPSSLAGKVTGQASLLVETEGVHEGRRVVRKVWTWMDHTHAARRHGTTGTAWLTGTGAAAGALVLLEGAAHPGVLAPEQLDPDGVLSHLRGRDVVVHEKVTHIRRLS